MAQLVATFIDKSRERSVVTMPIDDQGGSVTITDIGSFVTTLESALNGVSLATLYSIAFRQQFVDDEDATPASPYAQREAGIRIFYHDTAGSKRTVTVPAPDMANCDLVAAGDEFDLTDTEMAALVTWIEANVTVDGNAVTVDKAVYIGRNT